MKAKKGKFFARGVHVGDRKFLSNENPIEILEAPDMLAIPLTQHIGKPADNSGAPIVPLHLRFRFLFRAQVPNRNIPSNHHLSVYINDSGSQKG